MQPRRTAEAGGRWRVLTLCWDHHRALLKLPLLGLLSPQTPFSLTLKLWDAYILESEHMLTAMVYTVRKAPERGVQAAEEAGRPARGPRGRPPERALGSSPAHGSPGHGRPPGVVPSRIQPLPTGGAPGWGAESSWWGPRWPDGICTPRAPPEAAPEGLQEFLQDTLSGAWALEDDAVLRQLQASMAELRGVKRDLLPPGALGSSLLRSHPPGQ